MDKYPTYRQPVTTQCWPFADVLIIVTTDDYGSTITLTVNAKSEPASPGEALAILASEIQQAARHEFAEVRNVIR